MSHFGKKTIYNHQLYLMRLNVVLDVALMFEIISLEFKDLVKRYLIENSSNSSSLRKME